MTFKTFTQPILQLGKQAGQTFAEVARKPYEAVWGTPSTQPSTTAPVTNWLTSNIWSPGPGEGKVESAVKNIGSTVSNWLTSNIWNPGAGTAKVESAVKNVGSSIASTAKNLWEGFKQKTSKWSPFW